MELFETHYYKLSKNLMSFLGQWPEQNPWKRRFIRIALLMVMLSIIIPEVIKFFNVLDDLDMTVECIPPMLLHGVSFSKCAASAAHMDDMMKLLQQMQKDWKSREGGKGSPTLRSYAERSRFISMFYANYMFYGGTLYVCAPLLPILFDVVMPLNETRPREFLFRTEYFVDQSEHFIPIFLHAVMTTGVSMIIVAACDTLYCGYVHYACAIFTELSEELRTAPENNNDDLHVNKADDHYYIRIVQCVKKHQEAIDFIENMEVTYETYFLCALGLNMLIMSVTCVQVVMKGDDINLVIRYTVYAFGQVMHCFFACAHGQLLINHSEDVNLNIYQSNWHTSSYRARRLLMLMMMRTIKPCQLTGGKILVISLDTFTSIVKTAMSYFTVLRSFQ